MWLDALEDIYKKNNLIFDDEEKIIRKVKLETTEENFCKGLSDEFIDYLKYVKKLGFEQEPDYKYLTNLFILLFNNFLTKEFVIFSN